MKIASFIHKLKFLSKIKNQIKEAVAENWWTLGLKGRDHKVLSSSFHSDGSIESGSGDRVGMYNGIRGKTQYFLS